MSKKELYYPDGKTKFKSEEDFIRFYEQIYFYENGDILLEKEIDDILAKAKIEQADYASILKWKTGGDYRSKQNVVTYQYGNINIGQFAEFAGTKAELLENPDKLFFSFCKCNKIGFVYGITLMYFLDSSKYPIYDRFAHFSLLAIQEGLRPGDIIKSSKILSPKVDNEKSARSAFEKYKSAFAELLVGSDEARLFEQDYSRSLDRAIWAYGHLFNDSKRNTMRGKALPAQ